jgi:hypothetical protein
MVKPDFNHLSLKQPPETNSDQKQFQDLQAALKNNHLEKWSVSQRLEQGKNPAFIFMKPLGVSHRIECKLTPATGTVEAEVPQEAYRKELAMVMLTAFAEKHGKNAEFHISEPRTRAGEAFVELLQTIAQEKFPDMQLIEENKQNLHR